MKLYTVFHTKTLIFIIKAEMSFGLYFSVSPRNGWIDIVETFISESNRKMLQANKFARIAIFKKVLYIHFHSSNPY